MKCKYQNRFNTSGKMLLTNCRIATDTNISAFLFLKPTHYFSSLANNYKLFQNAYFPQ